MQNTFKLFSKEIKWNINEPFHLYLWGDVHRDADACDVDRWKWFLQKAAKDKNAYYVGLGDVHDFASTKERSAIMKAELHETTMEHFDDIVIKKNIEFANEIKQMRGRLLGLIGGNHTWKFGNGKFSDEDLAERMETEYLGWLCVYELTFNFGNNRYQTVYMVLCHGKAGGKLIGTSINQVDDLKTIFPFADLYAAGHNHQRGAWPVTSLRPQKRNGSPFKLKQHRQYLVRSGSFLKSYVDGKSQYTTGGLMRPSDLGAVKLTISFHRNRKDGNDDIVTDIESTV